MAHNLRRITKYDRAHLMAMAQNMHDESPRYKDKQYAEAKVSLLIDMFLNSPLAAAWVIEHNGEVAGMLAIVLGEYFFGHDKYVTDVITYLRPEHRRGGAFPKMVKTAEDWCIEQGVMEFDPAVSFGAEMPAIIGAYEKLGYKIVSYGLRKELHG